VNFFFTLTKKLKIIHPASKALRTDTMRITVFEVWISEGVDGAERTPMMNESERLLRRTIFLGT